MAGKRWMTVTFAAIAIALAASRASAQAAPNQTQPTATTQPDVAAYIENLRKTIGEGLPQQRFDAAQRLVECRQQRARDLITQLLSGSDDRAQYACARAIAESTAPDSVWINSLAPLLNRDRATSDAAAKALSRYEAMQIAYKDALIYALRSAPAANRAGIVAALGHVVQKPVAQALVALVADSTQPPEIRTAANDALIRLSGQTPSGETTVFWNAWYAARDPRPEPDWRKIVVEEQHSALQTSELLLHERLAQFRDRENRRELRLYSVELPERKSALLLELLNDPDPDVRASGVFVAAEAVNGVQSFDPQVRARLFDLISDPSPEVRQGVAGVLFDLADANALSPILLQLQLESTLQIKLALIKALARTDNGALPVLRQYVRQDPPVIAAAAADAIANRSAPFFQNARDIQDGIDFLKRAMEDRTGPIGRPNADADSIDLRAHLVQAIAGLASRSPQQESISDLVALAGQGEPVSVRQKALLGIGSLGPVANELGGRLRQDLNSDPDPLIRRAAASALGSLGVFLYYDDLDARTIPQNESSPEVRAAARQACSQLLLIGDSGQTQQKADDLARRPDEVDRALEAYIVTCRKLAESKADSQTAALNLALDRQTVGNLYLNRKDPRDAIPYYLDALKYFQDQGPRVGQDVILGIIGSTIKAYLALDDFDSALAFGAKQIQRDKSTQDTVGEKIKDFADTITQGPASVESKARARRLIDMTLNMKNAGALNIDDRTREQLELLKNKPPPPPATNPAK